MAYNVTSVVTLGILKDAMTRLRVDYNGAVAQSGHLKFEKTDVIPTVETAQENVLYLAPGSDTAHYTAYTLIDEAIICIGETFSEAANMDVATDEEVAEMLDDVFGTHA